MPELYEILFLRAIKQLKQAKIHPDLWRLGGGTALRLIYNHRNSNDLDIFFKIHNCYHLFRQD